MTSQELFEELKSLIKHEYRTLINDEELIIYTEKEDGFRNLIIDEDCDVSYIFFAKDKSKTERKLYFWEDGLNYEEIINLL